MTQLLVEYLMSLGAKECKPSTKKHIKRNIEAEFSELIKSLKELARKAMKMCFQVLKESSNSRFDSYSRQEQYIDHIPYYLYLSGLSRAYFFRQPFSK